MVRRHGWTRHVLGTIAAAALMLSAQVSAQTLTLVPSPASPQPGQTLSLAVVASGLSDLYAWQFSLGFNPSVLQATTVTQGSYFGATTTSFGFAALNNTTGLVDTVYQSMFGPGPGVSGSGTLATLNFNVLSVGTSPLVWSDVIFLNSLLGNISVQANNSSVTAVPEPTAALLFAAGLVGVGALQWRRRQVA